MFMSFDVNNVLCFHVCMYFLGTTLILGRESQRAGLRLL